MRTRKPRVPQGLDSSVSRRHWEPWQGFEPWGGGVQRIPWAQMQEDWEGESCSQEEAVGAVWAEPGAVLTPAWAGLSQPRLPQDRPQTGECHLFLKAPRASCLPTLPFRPASCLASDPVPIPPTFSLISDLGMFALAPAISCPLSPAVSGGTVAPSCQPSRRTGTRNRLLSTLSKRNWSDLGLERQTLSSNDFPSKPQMHFVST